MSSPSTDKQDVFNWDAPVNADTNNDNCDTPEDIANAEVNLRANHVVIGYIYNPERTTNKRTGELIRKKPSYRLIKQQSYQLTNPFHIVALHEHLNAYHAQNKRVAVFVTPELWTYHDENAAVVTRYYWSSSFSSWEEKSLVIPNELIPSDDTPTTPASLPISSEQPGETDEDTYLNEIPVRAITAIYPNEEIERALDKGISDNLGLPLPPLRRPHHDHLYPEGCERRLSCECHACSYPPRVTLWKRFVNWLLKPCVE